MPKGLMDRVDDGMELSSLQWATVDRFQMTAPSPAKPIFGGTGLTSY